jgi:hypothetical protein
MQTIKAVLQDSRFGMPSTMRGIQARKVDMQAYICGRPARLAGKQCQQNSKAGRLAGLAVQQLWRSSKDGRQTSQAGKQASKPSRHSR